MPRRPSPIPRISSSDGCFQRRDRNVSNGVCCASQSCSRMTSMNSICSFTLMTRPAPQSNSNGSAPNNTTIIACRPPNKSNSPRRSRLLDFKLHLCGILFLKEGKHYHSVFLYLSSRMGLYVVAITFGSVRTIKQTLSDYSHHLLFL
jgi:hypothetical protein